MIELEEVTKIYTSKVAVKDLSMKILDGQITVLIGPSGCGKTTTLKMINRLIEATSGDIKIDGTSIYSLDPILLRRQVGYVIQEIGLFPHYTVLDNIKVVPEMLKWSKKKVKERANELLELVNLPPKEYSNKYPTQLSGGEKQRVGVARALAANPEILLMDEPFGAIDPINRRTLQDFFLELQNRLKKTVVFVTHDISEAIKMGDKIAIMKEGQLVQFDETRNILEHPENDFVEELLGSDRTIKRLAILKVKDHLDTEFAIVPISKCNNEELHTSKSTIIIKSNKGEILGYIDREEVSECKNIKRKMHQFQNVSISDNLLEVITLLLQSGRKRALVIEQGNKIA